MTTLHRNIGIGDSLSFDGGRIIVTLQERTGRRAALRLVLAQDVQVDKPRNEANDPKQDHRGVDFRKA
jgi:hypothetical protein